MKLTKAMTVVFCAVVPVCLQAKDSSVKETKSLEEIVSTAGYIPTLTSQAPGNVSSISSKDISLQNSKQLSDVLSKSAGIRMDKDTGYNGRPQIFMRGIPYGTILMMDGIILNDLEGEVRILQAISTQDIDHIEIVRGAFSSFYGSGGIGGVINIITKMPKKLEMTASLGYGNEIVKNQAEANFVKGYFSVGDVFLNGRLRAVASYGFTSSDGAYRRQAYASLGSGQTASATFQDGSAIKDGDAVGWIGRTAYLTQDARLKAEYDWNDNQTSAITLSLSTIFENQHSPISYIKDSNGTVYGYETTTSGNGSSNGYYNPFVGSGWGGFRKEYNILGSIDHKIYFDEKSSLDIRISSLGLINYWDDGCDGQNCSSVTLSNGTKTPDSTTQGKGSYILGGNGYSADNFASSTYLDVIYNNEVNKKHSFVVGFQARYMTSENSNSLTSNFAASDFYRYYYGVYKQNNSSAIGAAIFTNWQAKWLKNLSTNLGVRIDYWHNFGLSAFDLTSTSTATQYYEGIHTVFPSPKLAINYDPWHYTTLKASMGLAFRAPTAREMFAFSHAGNNQISNPKLTPEYGLQFDIGIEQRNPYGGVARLYYYQTEMYNSIYKNGDGSESNPYQNQNGGHSRYHGIELEVEQKIYRDLRLMGSYTYTRAILIHDPSNPQYDGNQIPSIPRHMGSFNLMYGGDGGIFGSLGMRAQSSAFTSIENKPVKFAFGNITSRVVFDAKVGYEFKNQTSLSLSILNFTNERYYDYYRGSGASFYVEITSKL